MQISPCTQTRRQRWCRREGPIMTTLSVRSHLVARPGRAVDTPRIPALTAHSVRNRTALASGPRGKGRGDARPQRQRRGLQLWPRAVTESTPRSRLAASPSPPSSPRSPSHLPPQPLCLFLWWRLWRVLWMLLMGQVHKATGGKRRAPGLGTSGAPSPPQALEAALGFSDFPPKYKKRADIHHAQKNEPGRTEVLCWVLYGWDGGWEARKKTRHSDRLTKSPATPRQLRDGPLLSSSSWGWGHLESLGEMNGSSSSSATIPLLCPPR